MGISMASNINAMQVRSKIADTGYRLANVFERLSSGLRINGADDDSAGLALSSGLLNDASKMGVAIRNSNDGISLAAAADAGLAEIQNILGRMSELATQSSNSVYTYSQRIPLQSEYAALGSEIERIANSTTFNGLNLLKNASSLTIQVGTDGTSLSQVVLSAVSGDLSSLGIGSSGGAYATYIDQPSAAASAISSLNTALTRIGSQRGAVGATISRLSFTISYLGRQRDIAQSAASKIRDADLAQDSAELVRLQVLQQGQAAVMAQANQQPSLVLRLLG